ncbi:predicted protein [Nematostella vectensis]|uniref:Phosphatidylserine decarboxylase proenzyme, mitochondrial n=1 Tax=Nematostella vectensis TaxID=45351 RepID=A7SGZ2_NEMVE|nr:phosphatidylserine decarboxylase proenzyme, mitochondrial isoform X2 [Nematostella vectensis]EDO37001.1 predicted protein [Nematostella vectensis]|eukprot:XP_001629064.1 predicted protein [Nematostella vectensis]
MPGLNCDVRFNAQAVVLILFTLILFASCSMPYSWSKMFGLPDYGSTGSWRFSHGLRRYLATLRWFSIPASVGFAYICYQQYSHIKKREQRKILSSAPGDLIADQWLVSLYRKLPFRAVSRAWGRVNDIELPVWLRTPVIGLYAWKFACNLEEAVVEDIKSYPNLGSFFCRELKPGSRPIDTSAVLTCPTDGCLLHCGEVHGDVVEQVKGVTYSLEAFLGPGFPRYKDNKPDNGKKFFHCVIYLAPGDYHAFHSPADWNVRQRRHFPGELLSVHPGVQRIISGLFNHNERVVINGTWDHGYFAFAAVGATNVGSIYVNFDEGLRTNQAVPFIPGSYSEIMFDGNGEKQGRSLAKGDQIGGFKLGSTIVLVFEAPENFRFCVEPGQKIKYGQRLGELTLDSEM